MARQIKNQYARATVSSSISKIEEELAKHGVTSVMKEYEGGEVSTLIFTINTPKGHLPIKLPVRYKEVAKVVFKAQWSQLTPTKQEQSKRIAWSNLRDWVEAQLALVQLEMVKIEEVFFPHIALKQGQTMYELYASDKLLPQ